MSKNSVGHQLRRHRAKHGLPRITAHTFRHCFATAYLKNGGDMEKLRNITGHTSYEMLKDYLHLAKIGGRAIADELEKVSLLKEL